MRLFSSAKSVLKTSLDSKDAFPSIFEFQVEPCLVIEVR